MLPLDLPPIDPRQRLKARGAARNPVGRFEPYARLVEEDGWEIAEEEVLLRTEVTIERPRSVITRNSSPDIPFDRSINPYRGCEHGCVYCFARPSHGYLGLSAGLDFETRLVARPEAPEVLARELGRAAFTAALVRDIKHPLYVGHTRGSAGRGQALASSRGPRLGRYWAP